MNDKPSFVYIEDDEQSRLIMKTLIMRVLGYPDLTVFEDSQNFIERLYQLEQCPSIIFMDIHLKPYDGFTLLGMLRQNADFAQTRVIALTASVMNEEVARLRTAGFDGALAKPIDPATFPEILNRILAGERVWNIA